MKFQVQIEATIEAASSSEAVIHSERVSKLLSSAMVKAALIGQGVKLVGTPVVKLTT
jgi:hypothetical protein